jgi:hypothetical protein
MKIKYEISITTSLEPTVLTRNILFQLRNLHYLVINSCDYLVEFRDDDWEFRNKSDILKKVDSGRFEIILIGDSIKLKYTYYVSIFTEILISFMIFILSFVIIDSYYALLAIVPLYLQLLIRMNKLKHASKELIHNIVS